RAAAEKIKRKSPHPDPSPRAPRGGGEPKRQCSSLIHLDIGEFDHLGPLVDLSAAERAAPRRRRQRGGSLDAQSFMESLWWIWSEAESPVRPEAASRAPFSYMVD